MKSVGLPTFQSVLEFDDAASDYERWPAWVSVANAYSIVGQPFDCEVLAKLSGDEVSPLQPLLPIAIRFNLVHEDGSMLASVPSQVALTVSLEIQPGNTTTAMHRVLPDPGGIDLEQVEKEILLQALEKTGWNQTRAAHYLNITRKTLIYRMEKFGLNQAGDDKPLAPSDV